MGSKVAAAADPCDRLALTIVMLIDKMPSSRRLMPRTFSTYLSLKHVHVCESK